MKKLLILLAVISLFGCGALTHSTIDKEDCLTNMGRYDTSCVIKDNFWRGATTIIFFDDDSCVVIWGKKCEFEKDDSLFVRAEWWAAPSGMSHWKYFLINQDETLKYSLINQRR